VALIWFIVGTVAALVTRDFYNIFTLLFFALCLIEYTCHAIRVNRQRDTGSDAHIAAAQLAEAIRAGRNKTEDQDTGKTP